MQDLWGDNNSTKKNLDKFHISPSSSSLERILWIAVILFNIASVYTSMLGMQLIFKDGGWFLEIAIPLLFAASLSLFLIFFSFKIAYQAYNDNIVWSVVGYILIAIVSIVLNFNAIFTSNSAESYHIENVTLLEVNLNTLAIDIKLNLKERKSILEKEKADAIQSTKFEDKHSKLKGKGPKYRKLLAKQKVIEARNNVSIKDHDKTITGVTELVESTRNKASNKSVADGRNVTKIYIQAIVELDTLASSLGINNNIDKDRLLKSYVNVKSVEFSIYKIVDIVGKLFNGKSIDVEASRFLISVILSILIDLMPLIAVLLSRPRISGAKDDVIDLEQTKISKDAVIALQQRKKLNQKFWE